MSRFFAFMALAALLCASAVSGQSQICGGQGYDLSSLAGRQFVYFDGSYNYAVAPCGVVNNATACPNPNYPDTAFCQAAPGRNGTSLAQYTAANSTWYASQDGKSVTQAIQDGTPCGNFYRETNLVFACDQSATTPVLVNVTEVHTCYYTAYFRTAAACTVNSNTATGVNGGVGSTFYDSRCGGGVYDLSPLSTQDLFWTPNATRLDTVWFLRVCGSVAHPNCSATAGQAPAGSGIPATQTAMLCQSDQTNPTGNDNAASFYVANQQLWTINNNGLSLSIQDGESCGNFNRETDIRFVCNASATTAVMTSVVETHTCYYLATVQTNLVCAGARAGSSSSSTGSAARPSSSTVAASTGGVIASSSTGATANSTTVPIVVASSSSTGTDTPNTPGNGASAVSASAMVMAAVLALVALML